MKELTAFNHIKQIVIGEGHSDNETLQDLAIIESSLKSLEIIEELKKILKMEITTDLKGNHYLFIDDIAVNDTIPITKEQADILKKGIYNE